MLRGDKMLDDKDKKFLIKMIEQKLKEVKKGGNLGDASLTMFTIEQNYEAYLKELIKRLKE